MSVGGCNCCDEPPCDAPSLEFRTRTATNSKPDPCGIEDYNANGTYWLVQTYNRSYTFAQDGGGCHIDQTADSDQVTTYTFDSGTGNCTGPVATCSGTVFEIVCESDPGCPGGGGGTLTRSYNSNCSTSDSGVHYCGGAGLGCSVTTSGSVVIDSDTTKHQDLVPSAFCTGSGVDTWTLSDQWTEETTAELITRTDTDLGSASWSSWSGSGSAYRNLSPDETSLTVRELEYRVLHVPTGTCYLKVWPRSRFTPEGGGSDVLTNLTPYEWIGSGNPCLSDSAVAYDHANNAITGASAPQDYPTSDGTTTVEIYKWSCVNGYIPPDDGSANGFPA